MTIYRKLKSTLFTFYLQHSVLANLILVIVVLSLHLAYLQEPLYNISLEDEIRLTKETIDQYQSEAQEYPNYILREGLNKDNSLLTPDQIDRKNDLMEAVDDANNAVKDNIARLRELRKIQGNTDQSSLLGKRTNSSNNLSEEISKKK